jgi:hypothetical protein
VQGGVRGLVGRVCWGGVGLGVGVGWGEVRVERSMDTTGPSPDPPRTLLGPSPWPARGRLLAVSWPAPGMLGSGGSNIRPDRGTGGSHSISFLSQTHLGTGQIRC